MKNQTVALFTILLFTGLTGITTVKAESIEENQEVKILTAKDVHEKNDSQKSENLINKIEAAQKEQMLKFVQKKHFIRESDYI